MLVHNLLCFLSSLLHFIEVPIFCTNWYFHCILKNSSTFSGHDNLERDVENVNFYTQYFHSLNMTGGGALRRNVMEQHLTCFSSHSSAFSHCHNSPVPLNSLQYKNQNILDINEITTTACWKQTGTVHIVPIPLLESSNCHNSSSQRNSMAKTYRMKYYIKKKEVKNIKFTLFPSLLHYF